MELWRRLPSAVWMPCFVLTFPHFHSAHVQVIHGGGTKWFLLHAFHTSSPKEWAALAGQYEAVMVADDDLRFDTCTLNRNFEIFRAYSLLLAQPSVCPSHRRATYWAHLYQHPLSVLRFVSFVEIMAPIFDMRFFTGVVLPTLHNAYTGAPLAGPPLVQRVQRCTGARLRGSTLPSAPLLMQGGAWTSPGPFYCATPAAEWPSSTPRAWSTPPRRVASAAPRATCTRCRCPTTSARRSRGGWQSTGTIPPEWKPWACRERLAAPAVRGFRSGLCGGE